MYSKTPQIFKKLSAANLTEKSIVSTQFVKIVDGLINDGLVEDYKSISDKYGYSKNLLSHIKAGRQDAPIELLYNVILDYKIDPFFAFGIETQ